MQRVNIGWGMPQATLVGFHSDLSCLSEHFELISKGTDWFNEECIVVNYRKINLSRVC